MNAAAACFAFFFGLGFFLSGGGAILRGFLLTDFLTSSAPAHDTGGECIFLLLGDGATAASATAYDLQLRERIHAVAIGSRRRLRIGVCGNAVVVAGELWTWLWALLYYGEERIYLLCCFCFLP
uniref:Uncharacterized protein n=1 Tax=Leersia perrieri TaxID=77586 RepID=A0A0D9XM95_9ORYZ